MPRTTTLCPYFQLSEDGAEPVEHALELDGDACASCRRPVLPCPLCPGANRLFSHNCRNCGNSLPPLEWPVGPGSADSHLLAQPLGLPQTATPCSLPPLPSAALLATGGALVQIGKSEQARVLHGDQVLATVPFSAALGNVVSTCLLAGLLIVGLPERLLVNDLVDALELSPGSPSRRRSLPLRGELAAPLASDGKQYLAALSRDQGRAHLQIFQLSGSRLQLSWTRPIEDDGARSFWLSLCHQQLLVARDDGYLECFSLESGELVSTLQVPRSLAFLSPLARKLQGKPGWIVAATDGSLMRIWWHAQKLESLPLAPGFDGPLFGIGADSQEIVLCHGKTLRRIDSTSGKIFELELPQYCTVAPWVQSRRSLVLSQEGTLYALSLASSSFQVEHALRLPGNFQGGTLAPVRLHGSLWLVDGDGLLIEVKLAG